MGLTPRLPCNATAAQFAAWATVQFGPDLGAHVPPLYTTVEQPAPLCRDYSASTSTSVYWQARSGHAEMTCNVQRATCNVQHLLLQCATCNTGTAGVVFC